MTAPVSPRLLDDERLSPLVGAVLSAAARETPWRRAFLQQIAPRSNDVIVEIGGGAMAPLIAQANPQATLIAVDDDEAALARTEARVREAGGAVHCVRGAAEHLAHLTAQWAPTKIVCSFIRTDHSSHEKLLMLRAAHSALRADGALHCAAHTAPSTPLMRSLFRTFQGVDAPEQGAAAKLVREAGFRAVDEARRFDTVMGAIALITARVR